MRVVFPWFPLLFVTLTFAGIVVLTLGLRGRPIFASPRCRKCNYDLRNMQFMSPQIGNCPECGAPLAAPDAVTFGRWQRQPRRILTGVALIVLPWALIVPLTYVLRASARTAAVAGPQGAAAQSTPMLLANLPKNVNSPWEWQELERRLKAGTLTNADVDAALAVLTADLNAARAAGKDRQPLHWSGTFVAAAIASGNVSQPQLDALCQAYYGAAPRFTMRSRAREGEPIPIVLNHHESWDLPGMRRCWALTSIVSDGAAKLAAKQRYGKQEPLAPDALSGTGRDGELHAILPHALPPGEHELALTYELGVISDQATLRGLDGKPGTPDKWPNPVARWPATVKTKITVLPKDQPLVTLVTDPAKDPFKTSKISVNEALARPSSKGVELVIKWTISGDLSPVVSYHVWLQAGAEKIDYGTLVAGKLAHGSVHSYNDRKAIKSLSPDVKSFDILLTPDTTAAERHVEIEEIWGQPLELKDVPVQRFDLETAK